MMCSVAQWFYYQLFFLSSWRCFISSRGVALFSFTFWVSHNNLISLLDGINAECRWYLLTFGEICFLVWVILGLLLQLWWLTQLQLWSSSDDKRNYLPNTWSCSCICRMHHVICWLMVLANCALLTKLVLVQLFYTVIALCRGIDLARWRELREERGEEANLEKFVQHVHGNHFIPNTALVDCTADSVIAGYYYDWLRKGIHVVTPNKKANSGPLDQVKESMLSFW